MYTMEKAIRSAIENSRFSVDYYTDRVRETVAPSPEGISTPTLFDYTEELLRAQQRACHWNRVAASIESGTEADVALRVYADKVRVRVVEDVQRMRVTSRSTSLLANLVEDIRLSAAGAFLFEADGIV